MCALFLFVPDIGIAAYAGDNTPQGPKALKALLEQGSDILWNWFTANLLTANPEKITYLPVLIKKGGLKQVTVNAKNFCELKSIVK